MFAGIGTAEGPQQAVCGPSCDLATGLDSHAERSALAVPLEACRTRLMALSYVATSWARMPITAFHVA